MMPTTAWKRMLALVPLLFLSLAWLVFAPGALGGQSIYLITSGISMLPDIENGDLVVLRQADTYEVGDVVAYKDPNIGAVLHRIIDHERERFVLQGDNNDFIDPHHPDKSEIMGRLWIHLPSVGSWFAKMQQPRNAAGLALVAGLVFAVPMRERGPRVVRRLRRNNHGGATRSPSPSNSDSPISLGPAGQAVASVVGVVAIASLALAALAFSQPITREATVAAPYEQRGEFTYSAESSGTVYDIGMATTGQPIYRELADDVAVTFNYELSSEYPPFIEGTYRLDAIVSQDDGWSRSISVVPETAFSGGSTQVMGTIDLGEIQTMVDSVRRQTGFADDTQREYSLNIVPSIAVEGELGGAAIQDTFAPELGFVIEPLVMRLAAVQSADGEIDPLLPTVSGSVEQLRTVPNHISLPKLDVNVTTAQQLARFGVGVSVIGGLLLVVFAWRSSKTDEANRIRARYGTMLIALRGSDLGTAGRVVDVATIEDLMKVAERESRMVLHQEHGSTHHYFVQDVDVTYRYQTSMSRTVGAQPRAESTL